MVRLCGDYDVGAVAELSELLSDAIALDDDDLVLDMAEVGFVDAAVIGVILRARSFLQLRARSLTLRGLPGATRAVLGICDLDVFVESTSPAPFHPLSASSALEAWVAVRRRHRADGESSARRRGRS